MKKNCKVPSFINFDLVTKITSIAFLSYIIINSFIIPIVISANPLINHIINLFIVIIWISFVLIYSIIKRYRYLNRIYKIEHHPCREIIKDFFIFFAKVSSNNSIFIKKNLEKFIKEQFINTRMEKSTANILIKNLLKKLKNRGEIEIYKEISKASIKSE